MSMLVKGLKRIYPRVPPQLFSRLLCSLPGFQKNTEVVDEEELVGPSTRTKFKSTVGKCIHIDPFAVPDHPFGVPGSTPTIPRIMVQLPAGALIVDHACITSFREQIPISSYLFASRESYGFILSTPSQMC